MYFSVILEIQVVICRASSTYKYNQGHNTTHMDYSKTVNMCFKCGLSAFQLKVMHSELKIHIWSNVNQKNVKEFTMLMYFCHISEHGLLIWYSAPPAACYLTVIIVKWQIPQGHTHIYWGRGSKMSDVWKLMAVQRGCFLFVFPTGDALVVLRG